MQAKSSFFNYLPGIVLFVLAVILGLCIYQDYGISWDEPIQRNLGLATYDYVFKNGSALFSSQDRFYGTGVEVPLILLEKWMRLTDSRDIYLMRHLVSHICFLVGALSFYVLVFRLFRNRFIACAGFVLLVFTPRIYAHSFFNSKDIPVLVMFIITLTAIQIAFEKNRPALFFIVGLLCGYTASIRILGLILVMVATSLLLLDLVWNLIGKKKVSEIVTRLVYCLLGFCIALYVCWPFLWRAPVHNLAEVFRLMSERNKMLLSTYWAGQKSDVMGAPWWLYFPFWFSVTVPVFWLMAGVGGIIMIIVKVIKKPLLFLSNSLSRNFLVYLGCFLLPVLLTISSHSVLYNDWRHLYFVYPSFLLLALYFIDNMIRTRYRVIIGAAFGLQFILLGYFMVDSHPFQEVYYNELVSHKKEYINEHFGLDYWGCSLKQGLDYLAATDKSDTIKIALSALPLTNNIMMLKKEDRKRIVVIDDLSTTDYILINNRGNIRKDIPYTKIVDSIKVLNSTVMCIYKLH